MDNPVNHELAFKCLCFTISEQLWYFTAPNLCWRFPFLSRFLFVQHWKFNSGKRVKGASVNVNWLLVMRGIVSTYPVATNYAISG